MNITSINVHYGFPLLLDQRDIEKISKKSKGQVERFQRHLRQALRDALNCPEMRERRFTLCLYAIPFAYTRPGSNGIIASNLVDTGKKIMGKPNSKPQERKATKPSLTLQGAIDAVIAHHINQHYPAPDAATAEQQAIKVLTKITKQRYELETALQEVITPPTTEATVEVEINLDELTPDTRKQITVDTQERMKANPELTGHEALTEVLTTSIEEAVAEEHTMKTETTNETVREINATLVDENVTPSAVEEVEDADVVSSAEQQTAEEQWLAENADKVKIDTNEGTGINWKLVGGIAAGVAVLGALGYVGYRQYQKRTNVDASAGNLTAEDEI